MHRRIVASGINLAHLKGQMVWTKNIAISFIALLTMTSAAKASTNVLRMSPCERASSGQLKPLKRIQPVTERALIDLVFTSKTQSSFAVLELSAVSASGSFKTLDTLKASEIVGGKNYLPAALPPLSFVPAFLMVQINGSQCFYAQINSLRDSDFVIASLEPKILPFALSYQIQAARFDLVTFIGAFFLFGLLYLWLEHSRRRRTRLELPLR